MACIRRGQVPFILPRTNMSEQCQRETLDGIATVLLSYVVDRTEVSERQLTSPVDVECRSNSNLASVKLMDVDDDNVSMQYAEMSTAKASTSSSIDLPFDAHVLPTREHRFYAILPLLCVTDEANIVSLMSSVLYQRYVWGIADPLIGISFSKYGTIGQVLLGWLDLESPHDDNLVCNYSSFHAYAYQECSLL